MIVVWVNKQNWKKPGPIANVAVHNAHSFASIGLESHFFIGESTPSDTDADLRAFYGLDPVPSFHIHRVPRSRPLLRSESSPIFSAAARFIRKLSQQEDVVVFTRESGFLPYLWWLK